MSTWQVLKSVRLADRYDAVRWEEVGTHESDSPWYAGYQAPQEIGEKHGAGEYLLLGEESRYQRITIAARQEFYEIDQNRYCKTCGADIDGNDPHNPECPLNTDIAVGPLPEGSHA